MDLVIAFLICLFVGSCQEVDGVDWFHGFDLCAESSLVALGKLG